MIKQIRTALTKIARTGLDVLQAGARSTQGNSLNYMSVGTLDPSRLARAFAAADEGFISDQAALFELVEEQDSHIFAELSKRRRSVTGLGWELTPPDDANQSELDRTKELSDVLRAIPRFEDAQYDLTDAIGKGFAAMEIDWKTGSTWMPNAMLWVPQRMFQVDRNTGSIQFLKMGIPEPLKPWKWVVHEHRAKSGYIEQSALFRVLAWTYAYKAYNVRDMQRFLEVYGLPLRLGKYPAGIGAKQRDELLKAVRNIGHDGAGVVPNTMSIDFVQATKSGTVSDFLDSIAYWERKQSLAILGGTLTSQADGRTSTNALGVIHDKVRREIMLHDVRQIVPTMNDQVVRPIALINGMFTEERMPKFGYLTEETVDQSKMADVLTKAADIGMEIDVEWAHNAMQIPRASKGAALLKASSRNPQLQTPADSALTRLAALASTTPSPDVDVTAAYAAQLASLCASLERSHIEKIANIVASAGSYEEALTGIEALTANDPKWAEAMALGMTAAHLAGRADVGGAE
ncbi:DUF935 domain-containing protein [Pandoraea apista]|uniref:Mu-like prophage FluMu protein gp29 n=1 Tax=Pandoraea apista TaxID=93218 RepID=A0A5E5P645_9BURK|nr:DUF935 family protein [Pandoraea apista]AJF00073.1 Mu-like prophage FluMu protein gp29 [Pandoraea apista]AKH74227.1 Mu-like prophage FluMu protein gp29 [Pandoraea apista]AKI62776.1 Mu-like prophage FluMu protein gp29 [Pandoraea apista]VVG72128.1 Mu-like prophage FluMu protein gp29 [Pandoraea apista]